MRRETAASCRAAKEISAPQKAVILVAYSSGDFLIAGGEAARNNRDKILSPHLISQDTSIGNRMLLPSGGVRSRLTQRPQPPSRD